MPEKVYRPGDVAPQSGVYRVVHDGHRSDHEVSFFKDEMFPSCLRCGPAVGFVLLRTAGTIHDDIDFNPRKS
jgi:hypothetical protein